MTTTEAPLDPGGAPAPARPRQAARPLWLLWVAVAALIVVIGLDTPRFFTIDNARAILSSSSLVGIAALGLLFIVASGNLVSLAIGSTASVGAMVLLSNLSLSLPVALVLAALACGLIAAVQGVLVGHLRANPIIITIAAAFAIDGAATAVTDGTTIAPETRAYQRLNDTVGGLPIGVYVLLVLTVIATAVIRYTRFGRELYLVGENRQAAYAAGLPVGRIITIAFAVAGAFFGIAGAFAGSFNQGAVVSTGQSLTFDAIAAALVGGVAILGGRGSAFGVLIGTLVITTITDLLLLRSYGTGAQTLVKGLLIVVVIVGFHLRNGRQR